MDFISDSLYTTHRYSTLKQLWLILSVSDETAIVKRNNKNEKNKKSMPRQALLPRVAETGGRHEAKRALSQLRTDLDLACDAPDPYSVKSPKLPFRNRPRHFQFAARTVGGARA